MACNYIKKRHQHRCFPVKIGKFLRTRFFTEHLRCLLPKIHLYYSHFTGKIHDFAHNFCNWKVRLTDTFICIVRKFFGFNFYLLLKGFNLSVSKARNLSIGGSNLTKINYAYLGNTDNYINTLKYYLKAQIAREGKNSSERSHGTISAETDTLKLPARFG